MLEINNINNSKINKIWMFNKLMLIIFNKIINLIIKIFLANNWVQLKDNINISSNMDKEWISKIKKCKI